MSKKSKSNNGLQNRSGFALMTVALFLFSGLAAVSASPVQKESGASTYASANESVISSATQYGYDGDGVNIGHPGYGAAGSQLSRFSER
ncbi:MAG: hypothetical protein NZ774_01930, partial [Candidatus Poseidoniales archaeon]|nr:hypothetical protein [Candidatus Poseidoniales archaeon]